MEAMSAGLPCIVSKIRGNVDLIEDGKGGYLCDPWSIDQFAEGIEKANKNMGTYNIEVMKNFDVNGVIQKTKKIYLGLEG